MVLLSTGQRRPGGWIESALRAAPLHPFFLGAYPALALLAANAGQAQMVEGLRSILGSLALAAGLLAGYWILTGRRSTSSALASVSVLVLLSYGRLYDGLKEVGLSGSTLVRHRYLIPLVGMALLGVYFALRRADLRPRTNWILNLVALTTLALPAVRLGANEIRAFSARAGPAPAAGCSLEPDGTRPLPDVYIIVMDAYERDDVLWEMHGFDNSPFLDALTERGFYVARGSLSNYRHTELSLASMLNIEYLPELAGAASGEAINRWEVVQSIRDNRVRRELECLGFTTVATETGAFWTEWEDADYYLSRRSGALGNLRLIGGASRFEGEFLATTIARAGLDGMRVAVAAGSLAPLSPAGELRDLIRFQFEQLGEIPRLPSPKLVFVHVLSPHPPFVFGADGEPVDLAEFDTGRGSEESERALLAAYVDQVVFLNARLIESVDAILARSSVPPIIIIQGDHGWADRDAEDKISILNAVHLPPPAAPGLLWPTITPVNSFRVIFREYFGGDLATYPDRSYFSHETDVLNFVEVENTWSGEP